jgi:hypothetical protein
MSEVDKHPAALVLDGRMVGLHPAGLVASPLAGRPPGAASVSLTQI